MKRTALLVACAATAALALATPASAAPNPLSYVSVTDRANTLFSPLSFAVDGSGNAYVAQNFIGQLTKIAPNGAQTPVASTSLPGGEIGAVTFRDNTLYYADNDQPNGVAHLMKQPLGGSATMLADLGAYEASANPDQVNTYGFVGLPDECAVQVDPAVAGPASYAGVVDTHPYGATVTADGVYVADAGGNAVVKVDNSGSVSTVAVLPPTAPVTVTAELAAAFGFPACTAGYAYAFEPVPTDVEVGPGGWLYVTTLPGGPEDASLGARGVVYKINPATGEIRTVATGFVSATNLAVDRTTGTVLVTELFGGADGTGRVSAVLPWSSTPVAALPVSAPAAIELRGGKLYVTRNAFGPEGPAPTGVLTVVQLTGVSKYLDGVS
ncbi:ScyD/ScyE family protein [Microbacteriaceae bacterium VKM Ac-2855]|nr:ScyD/ScyE family protein [Microbacteriaceae bacterium VKM Ac-2855]